MTKPEWTDTKTGTYLEFSVKNTDTGKPETLKLSITDVTDINPPKNPDMRTYSAILTEANTTDKWDEFVLWSMLGFEQPAIEDAQTAALNTAIKNYANQIAYSTNMHKTLTELQKTLETERS